jgi:predicted house-cleaning NTP pyrophosphatase (Maf/HAM1 superfamily)
MIIRHLDALSKKKIILASASPRRLEILTKTLGLKVEVPVPHAAQQTW